MNWKKTKIKKLALDSDKLGTFNNFIRHKIS